MPTPESLPQIERASIAQRPETLRVLGIGSARVQRLLQAAERGEIDMEGLFLGRRGELLVGAAWGQRIPGRSAFCWPATTIAGEPESTAVELNRAVNDYLDASQVAVTQAMLSPRDVINAIRLTELDYQHLADLDFLVSTSERFPSAPPVGELHFVVQPPDGERRISALIQRTYVRTLDCAKLEGVRTSADAIDGYRRTGTFRPDWWIIAEYRGADVGCVLLADYPELKQGELMYLGVVPEMRGHDFGYQLACQAQWLMRVAGRERLVLAVDDANWPARQIYERAGFLTWDRRSVYVRTPHTSGASSASHETS